MTINESVTLLRAEAYALAVFGLVLGAVSADQAGVAGACWLAAALCACRFGWSVGEHLDARAIARTLTAGA